MSPRIETRVPVAAPDLSPHERSLLLEAFDSGWISSTGRFVDQFESRFAEVCGVRRCLSVANGTVALHLVLAALGLGPGDEVIVPSLTYIASVNAVRYVGATPVFVDVDPDTWCLDPEAVKAAVTDRTRVIMAVHLYGHPAPMDELNEIARARGLVVVEDAAEAPFARYKGRPTGGLAPVATFSFYGNKILTSGEGGAVTFQQDELADRCKLLRGQGMDPKRRYFFPVIGFNFRLTNPACALLCAQLDRSGELLARRNRVFAQYRARLDGVTGVRLQKVAPWAEVAPWLYCVLIDREACGKDRDQVAVAMAAAGVETRPFFPPIHRLPPYEALAVSQGAVLPHTDALAAAGMNLPTFSTLTEAQVDLVCDTLIRVVRG